MARSNWGAWGMDSEMEAIKAICASQPLLRLRFVRGAKESSDGLPLGFDRGASFCLLSDLLGDPGLATSAAELNVGWSKPAEPKEHPRKRAEARLRALMAESGVDKRFKLADGPVGFLCPQTGMWGLRAELRAKASMPAVDGPLGKARERLDREIKEMCLDRLGAAGGFAFSDPVQASDVRDCDGLFEHPGPLGSLSSLIEADAIKRSAPGTPRPVDPAKRRPAL